MFGLNLVSLKARWASELPDCPVPGGWVGSDRSCPGSSPAQNNPHSPYS